MRKMVPSEENGVSIEQITLQVPTVGWQSDIMGDNVTYFSKDFNLDYLKIKENDVVIITPTTNGNDTEVTLMTIMKNGLTFYVNKADNYLYIYTLVDPSTYSTALDVFDIQVTIFRQKAH